MFAIYKNLYWRIFLAIIAIIVLIYTGNTALKIYRYLSLSQQIPVESIHWSPVSKSEDIYFSEAQYSYLFEGVRYEGQGRSEEIYLNAPSAQEDSERFNRQRWKIWIDPTDPSFSALQKKFPFKQSVSTVILWGLLAYFFWLGQYVKGMFDYTKDAE